MMDILTTENYFPPVQSPELSPSTQSPMSTSPLPPDPLAHQEHSLHIIVEPHIDGQTNYIHLINPPTGKIIQSYIADHGSCIEIQPGVLFRVPYPYEHMVPSYVPQQPPGNFPPTQQQQYYPPANMPHPQLNVPMISIPSQQYNPQCLVHGSPGASASQSPTPSEPDGDIDTRKEKLQKKISEHQGKECTCFKHSLMLPNNGYHHPTNGHIPTQENGEECPVITIPDALKVEAVSPYAIVVRWEDCVKQNQSLQMCNFELQLSCKGNTYKSIYGGNDNVFTVHDLTPGTAYAFRLCAFYSGKQGPFSDIVSCTTLASVPDRPLAPRVAQKNKNSLAIKWVTPFDGGSPITLYKLQWNKGDNFEDLYSGLQKQFKFSHKLPPGTPCHFRVQAHNQLGASDFSALLECLTSAGPPSVPQPPSLVRNDVNLIALQWSPPECNGSPVTEYRLEMDDPSGGYGFMVQYCGEQTNFTCSNLQRNTQYKFRLAATNGHGTSKYCTPVSFTTLSEPPGKMNKPKLSGKVKAFSVPLKWALPKDTGGEEIIGYFLEMDDGMGGQFYQVYHGSDTEFVSERLKPGHTYQFRVASQSRAGIGSFSPVSSFTTLAVCPKTMHPPTLSTRHTPQSNALHLHWNPPLDCGGAPVTHYTLKMAHPPYEDFSVVYSGGKTEFSVLQLGAGTDYVFQLQATNNTGSSPWSPSVTLQTAPGPPDAVETPKVSFKTPTHAIFEWKKPQLHGTPVTLYCLEKLENEVFQKVYQGSCNSCEVKRGILPAQSYFFRLQAHSVAGSGPYGTIFTVETPSAPPAAVSDIKILDQTSSSCLVEWRHPVDNGSRVTEYVIEATGATSLMCTVARPPPLSESTPQTEKPRSSSSSRKPLLNESSDDESSDEELDLTHSSNVSDTSSSATTSSSKEDVMEYRLSGLVADTSYKLRIQALNECGAGGFSHPVQFYTKELPPCPPHLSAGSVSYHSIKLKWSDHASKNKHSVLTHTLQMQNKSGSFSTIYSGIGGSFTLSKLKELTPYCCHIRSKNDAGEGEFSKPKIFYTKPQLPQQVKDLECEDFGMTHAHLTWPAVPKIRDDDVIEYVIQKQNSEQVKDLTQLYRGECTEFRVKDLSPDTTYNFRVFAVRLLSKAARQQSQTETESTKGIYSSFTRVHTRSQEQKNAENVCREETVECSQESQVRSLTDTHIALIILASFLAICVIISALMTHVFGEYVY